MRRWESDLLCLTQTRRIMRYCSSNIHNTNKVISPTAPDRYKHKIGIITRLSILFMTKQTLAFLFDFSLHLIKKAQALRETGIYHASRLKGTSTILRDMYNIFQLIWLLAF